MKQYYQRNNFILTNSHRQYEIDKRGVIVVDAMNLTKENAVGSILFIIKDDGRDIKYENACRMWKMDVVIEHAFCKGLKKAIEEDYDMVVVDDYLGDKSGYTLSMEILNKKKVVLYMLGNDQDDISVIGAFRAGITDYIRADVSAIQLAARCNTIIMRSQNEREKRLYRREDDKIMIGDFILDTWNGYAQMQGHRVSLLKMEVEVLQVLMEHANHVLTKQEIYEKAWNTSYIMGENSVPVHVSKIRKKLETINAEKCIETKWGTGYRFRVDEKIQ